MQLKRISLRVNGHNVSVWEGSMVSTAVVVSGVAGFRRSTSGELRGPVCGMGICFECRVTIDGRAHSRSCQVPCRDGMDISTDD